MLKHDPFFHKLVKIMNSETKLYKLIAKATIYILEGRESADPDLSLKIIKKFIKCEKRLFLNLDYRIVGEMNEKGMHLDSGAAYFSQWIELAFSSNLGSSEEQREEIILTCQPLKEICDLLAIKPEDFKTNSHKWISYSSVDYYDIWKKNHNLNLH